MCEFVSWIEKDGKLYYLKAKQVFETTRGKQLQKWCGNSDDYVGHGAIRYYYGFSESVGNDHEGTDFSSPDNFPAEIVKAIKAGEFRGLAVAEKLLSQPALAEYEKVRQSAWAEYKKIRQSAWAEYEKVRQSAWAEYEKVEQSAFWDLFANSENRNPKWV